MSVCCKVCVGGRGCVCAMFVCSLFLFSYLLFYVFLYLIKPGQAGVSPRWPLACFFLRF